MRVPSSITEAIRSPSFFDNAAVREAILPEELLRAWIASARTVEDAEKLLSPYEVYGTVLISDAGGLSKLSGEHDLIDLLSLIHEPKKTIHALTSCIGGVPMGTWVADNTTVFFPEGVPREDLREMLTSIQEYLAVHLVKTGVGVHTGLFYRIGNTLFGPSLEHFDEIAENQVPAGQVWVSSETVSYLNLHTGIQLRQSDSPDFFVLPELHKTTLSQLHTVDAPYPHAFSDEFYSLLDLYTETKDASVKKMMLSTHVVAKSVFFLKYYTHDSETLSGYMDTMLVSLLWKDAVRDVSEYAQLQFIKAEGKVAILLADEDVDRQILAKQIQTFILTRGFTISIGVDKGEILLFERPSGYDVAGEAINIASKLAEDLGKESSVYLAVRGQEQLTHSLECSGIHIPVISLS